MDINLIVDNAVIVLCNLSYCIVGYSFYRMACCLAVRRKGWVYTAVCCVSCPFLVSMVIYPNDMFNVTFDFIWIVAVMLLCFKGSILQKLSVAAVLYPLIIAQNFLIEDIGLYIYIGAGRSFWAEQILRIVQSCIIVFFWIVLYRTFKNRLKLAGRLFDNKTWLLLGSVCMASMVSITVCIYFTPEETYKIWPCAVACMVTNISSLYLAGYFTQSIRMGMEQKNMRLQQAYYEELDKNQTQIRKVRHDMNNHLSVIRELFENGRREEADQYFKEVERQILDTNRVFCKNSIVNAVLNARYNQAAELGIDCFFHIDLSHVNGIDPVSLCTIFSNTLDNAIEASMKIENPEKRKISVKARCTENGYFSYEITNAKSNPIKLQKGRYLTSKEDSVSHGLGLWNVQEIVEKYGGTIDISYTDQDFSVTILIGGVA